MKANGWIFAHCTALLDLVRKPAAGCSDLLDMHVAITCLDGDCAGIRNRHANTQRQKGQLTKTHEHRYVVCPSAQRASTGKFLSGALLLRSGSNAATTSTPQQQGVSSELQMPVVVLMAVVALWPMMLALLLLVTLLGAAAPFSPVGALAAGESRPHTWPAACAERLWQPLA